MRGRPAVLGVTLASLCLLAVAPAHAQVGVQQTRFELPASNGHGAILVDLSVGQRRVTHFREHLFAAEEPVLDADLEEVWGGSDFEAVFTRDLLFDTYFGLRDEGGQGWLPDVAVDYDASGYLGFEAGGVGGTGIVTMVQQYGDLEATQYFFAPDGIEHAAFAMVMRVTNTGGATVDGAQAFSIHNFHLGFGRPDSPWDLFDDIGDNGESLTEMGGGAWVEEGFAGAVAILPLGPVAHHGVEPGFPVYATVDGGGTTDLGDNGAPGTAVDGAVLGLQYDLGDLDPGESEWVGVVVAHHGDPSATDEVLGWVEDWADGRSAEQVLDDEVGVWAARQDELLLPEGLSAYEELLLRHSAAMLHMGQVRENEAWLREFMSEDGEVRRTRFPSKEDPADLPGWVAHNGRGAVLASLPPGNWTYAWIRDGAYATSAMAVLGMHDESRDSLTYYLDAEAGRFQDWMELSDYDMPPYQITLTRYYGFGVEETDFNDFGPNLEFDGFGLYLWALGNYERLTDDTTISEERWDEISVLVGDVLLALLEPDTGLLLPDSSIWETHWNGRERHWAYTNITAARGLCDAAEMAERVGDRERAASYREAGETIRDAIAQRLTDREGGIASNLEELAMGEGYWDSAVVDAIAMGLFDPEGAIATATLAGLDEHLLTEASEVGWARNDDPWDHAGADDISPWGSEYDRAEWVITDLRGAMAWRAAGDAGRSEAILDWITAQSLANFLMVAETYDEETGEYKFNHPMMGFGAGAYALTLAHRDGLFQEPACGAYYDEDASGDDDDDDDDTGGTGGGDDDDDDDDDADGTAGDDDDDDATGGSAGEDGGASISATLSAGSEGDGDEGGAADDGGDGCSCRGGGGGGGSGWLVMIGLLGLVRGRRRAAAVLGLGLLAAGCADDASGEGEDGTTGDEPPTTITTTVLPSDGSVGDDDDDSDDTTGGDDDDDDDDDESGDETGGGTDVDVCPTEFSFDPGFSASNVRVAGAWHGFELGTATPLVEEGGVWTGSIDLEPGLHGYKIVYDDGGGTAQWIFDPGQARRTYDDGVENSAVVVADCNLPSLTLDASEPDGTGTYEATLTYVDGAAGTGPDAAGFVATLRHDFSERPLGGNEWDVDADSGDVSVSLTGLATGKYTVVLTAASASDRISEPLRLVFWIEDEPFSWEDALIYMVVTDRYRNGDPGNDEAVAGSDPTGDFWGGDLQGLADSIEEGLLDELGVRAIWLTPWQTNPDNAYLASDGQHLMTGYHGYWPTRAREVDSRFGGEEGLRAVVSAAHAHGIRILQDYVINHVHEDHEYVAEHPDWFRIGCVCGTDGCDWTADALECQFTPYMPDIDHTVAAANAQFVEDAVWWVDEYDLDGLRVDAVKHVEEAATRNLAAAVRETFEPAGTRYFMMGETAMGWSDCPDPCNDENYGTIAQYVGPHGLDGQFDFVLYHGVSYRTFAHSERGMIHADYWFAHGQTKWPDGAIMTPYIGSHDTPRFTTMADYRGQDAEHGLGVPGTQWGNIAVEPGEEEPYLRTQAAMGWLMGLPGAPLLYYGDEYGQWGGADPNNRLMWRAEDDLTAWEADTLAVVRELGTLRQEIPALRRGDYLSLDATEDVLVFARYDETTGAAAVVGVNRSDNDETLTVGVVQLDWAPGTELEAAVGGPGTTVSAIGQIEVNVPAWGTTILVP